MLINNEYKIKSLELNKIQQSFYNIKSEGIRLFTIVSEVNEARANVIMVPPYGKGAHQNFLIGNYLLKNKFNTIRFDGVDSVGLSTGVIMNYKMSRLEKDLNLLVKEIKSYSKLPLVCLSMSLSFPIALKYASENDAFSQLIAIVGVLDPSQTLERVINHSLDEWKNRLPEAQRLIKVFGHDILAQEYLDDMWQSGYLGLAETIRMGQKLQCPLKMIVAAEDEYVELNEFKEFCNGFRGDLEYLVIEKASHELGKSIPLCKKIGKLVTGYALNGMPVNVIVPQITDIINESSVETNLIRECELCIQE